MHIFAVLEMELELSSVKTVYIMSFISLFNEHKKIPQGISQNKLVCRFDFIRDTCSNATMYFVMIKTGKSTLKYHIQISSKARAQF